MKKIKAWQEVSKKMVYENPFMRIFEYSARRPNGKLAPYWVLDRNQDFAIIVAQTSDGEIYLVGQYRFPIRAESWEFPMGSVRGLEPLAMAKRELKEETGLTAKKWHKIGQFYVTPGHSRQQAHVFFAQELQEGEPEPEENEFLEVQKVSLEKIDAMINSGQIIDAPTIATQCLFKNFLGTV